MALNLVKLHKKPIVYTILSAGAIVAAALWLISIKPQTTNAADLTKFDPGNIISDAVMSNKSSMTEKQIQSFLKSKNSCKSTGNGYYNTLKKTKDGKQAYLKSSDGKTTWRWNIKNGHFVCMAEDKFGGETAARIIYRAAQDYNINPQSLIVMLEKESSLITDGFPHDKQYDIAMGYGCPDTGPGNTANCSSKYYGLKNQIRLAAALFREVLDGGWTNYPVGTNYIQYHPNASCGTQKVNIKNRATSALYRYTPYVPNRAALNAGYGTGDSCSAYGNRNFYSLFTDWFGNTQGGIEVSNIKIDKDVYTDTLTTAEFTIKNKSSSKLQLGNIGLAVRGPSNNNVDFDFIGNVSIAAGKTFTYKKSRILNGGEGKYQFFIARHDGQKWRYPAFDDLGQLEDNDIYVEIGKKPTLTKQLTISNHPLHANETFRGKFTVRNNSQKYTLNLGSLGIAVRDENNKNYDLPFEGDVTLKPGQTYSYNQSSSLPEGSYRFWIANWRSGFGWQEDFPFSQSPSLIRSIDPKVKSQTTLTSSLDVSAPREGSTASTFKIKNFGSTPVNIGTIGVAARNEKGQNYDIGWSKDTVLQPGQERTFTYSRKLPAGKYNLWIANHRNGVGWSEDFPSSETSGIVRSTFIQVK